MRRHRARIELPALFLDRPSPRTKRLRKIHKTKVPREYQANALDQIRKVHARVRSVIAVSPTGSGKTVIAAAYCKEFKKVLWVTHRVELVRQAVRELEDSGIPESEIGVIGGGIRRNVDARILVVTISAFRGTRGGWIKPDIPDADLIVVDEAHHARASSYMRILRESKCLVLGLTATPWRLDGLPLADVFDEIVVAAESMDLIRAGWIARPVVYGVSKKEAASLIHGLPNCSSRDWSAKSLEKGMCKRPIIGKIFSEWSRLSGRQKTIVYACSRAHGKEIVLQFTGNGVDAAFVDFETSQRDRRSALEKLADGDLKVVVNVGLFSEGFDCPPVKCIVVARPTKSLTLWRQMCGRAVRPYKNKRPVILDHAGNTWRFGLPEMPWDWRLSGYVSGVGKAWVKLCHSCGVHIFAGFKNCPECGTEQPFEEQDLTEREAKLSRISPRPGDVSAMRSVVEDVARDNGLMKEWVDSVVNLMVS